MSGKFGETPIAGKKYCFPDAFLLMNSTVTVSLECENYCLEGGVDKDRPVAGECTAFLYQPKTVTCEDAHLLTIESTPMQFNFNFNEGCDPQEGTDTNGTAIVTGHQTARCFNCCSGVGALMANPLNLLFTLVVS